MQLLNGSEIDSMLVTMTAHAHLLCVVYILVATVVVTYLVEYR